MTTEPREGWYWAAGRWLFHANWSRSWDGWGTTHAGGRVTRKFVELSHTRTSNGFPAVTLIVWRLLLRVGMVAA